VKRSVHRKSGHVIALKTYDKKNLTNENVIKALHSEIYFLAILEHPSIMRLYEVIDNRTQVHLVMELCTGKNLFHHLRKRKPIHRLYEPEAAKIFIQIASAVAYMHSCNIVHRDLKLENVLINEENNENQVKIIDFGFATQCKKDQKLSLPCGTHHYMDPDLIRKRDYFG